mmetsp:Transcript_34097/g.106143  ORF Transcript_34097/g.106143 Transcript_34097/m.106143 type:complete len:224 (+) Transcript_34097:272-943(+)
MWRPRRPPQLPRPQRHHRLRRWHRPRSRQRRRSRRACLRRRSRPRRPSRRCLRRRWQLRGRPSRHCRCRSRRRSPPGSSRPRHGSTLPGSRPPTGWTAWTSGSRTTRPSWTTSRRARLSSPRTCRRRLGARRRRSPPRSARLTWRSCGHSAPMRPRPPRPTCQRLLLPRPARSPRGVPAVRTRSGGRVIARRRHLHRRPGQRPVCGRRPWHLPRCLPALPGRA